MNLIDLLESLKYEKMLSGFTITNIEENKPPVWWIHLNF